MANYLDHNNAVSSIHGYWKYWIGDWYYFFASCLADNMPLRVRNILGVSLQ